MPESRDLYRLLRPLIFRLQPETAHGLCFALGGLAQRVPGLLSLAGPAFGGTAPRQPRQVLGLAFPSALGMAAGLDKGAQLLPLWKALGFGFVEIGTVTPRPQPGNPKPRVFRFPDEQLILNRMGFNSEGAEVVARRLRRRPAGLIVGGNLGKNKLTAEEQALDDYRAAYRLIAPEVDYVALNISSPNTPGLRNLQAPAALRPLLEGMLATRKELGLEAQPLLVKLAPDLSLEELDGIIEVVAQSGVSGIIATNTTLDRSIVSPRNRARVEALGAGGLSGQGLHDKARAVRQRILAKLPADMAFMACGGLGSGADAAQALEDGAALVQIYSALIFRGPAVVAEINRALAER